MLQNNSVTVHQFKEKIRKGKKILRTYYCSPWWKLRIQTWGQDLLDYLTEELYIQLVLWCKTREYLRALPIHNHQLHCYCKCFKKMKAKLLFSPHLSELFRSVRTNNCIIQSCRNGYGDCLVHVVLPLQSLGGSVYPAKSRHVFQHT